MTIFRMPRFLRRLIRKVMDPVSAKEAWTTREKISLAYAVIAWHALAFVGYQVYMGNKSWPETMGIDASESKDMRPALKYSYLLGVRKAEVYRIRGLHMSEAEHIALTEQASQTQPQENPVNENSEFNES